MNLWLKKQAMEDEKNKIFEKLSLEQEQRQNEKEYWENVRNELYQEEMNRRLKIQQLMEEEKKTKAKRGINRSSNTFNENEGKHQK